MNYFSFGIVCDARLKSSIEIQCIVFHTKDKRLKSCSSVLDSLFKLQIDFISVGFFKNLEWLLNLNLVLFIISKSFQKGEIEIASLKSLEIPGSPNFIIFFCCYLCWYCLLFLVLFRVTYNECQKELGYCFPTYASLAVIVFWELSSRCSHQGRQNLVSDN